jgi:uncharacterized protein YjbJ (UPF0337 family)
MGDLKTEGRIDRIRGRVRQMWGDVTDDDIDQARGNTENLVGRIKEKTGETAEDIRGRLQQMFDEDDEEVRGS